jgi:hypothetical protein
LFLFAPSSLPPEDSPSFLLHYPHDIKPPI